MASQIDQRNLFQKGASDPEQNSIPIEAITSLQDKMARAQPMHDFANPTRAWFLFKERVIKNWIPQGIK